MKAGEKHGSHTHLVCRSSPHRSCPQRTPRNLCTCCFLPNPLSVVPANNMHTVCMPCVGPQYIFL